MKRIIASAALLMAVILSASAQRTVKNTVYLDLKGGTNFYSWAGSLQVGLYSLWGYYYVATTLSDLPLESQKGSIYSVNPIVVDLGAMYRFAGTQNRVLNGYVGGSILLGDELADPFARLPKEEQLTISDKFIYGLRPRVEMEWFFWSRLGLVVSVDMPVYIGSQVQTVSCNALAGFRINF